MKYRVQVIEHYDAEQEQIHYDETFAEQSDAINSIVNQAKKRFHPSCADCAFKYMQIRTNAEGMANMKNSTMQQEIDGITYVLSPWDDEEPSDG